jgi:peptide/nickel transport system permease protein
MIAWRHLRRDLYALLGGVLVLVALVCAVAAPILAPHDPLKINPAIRLSPPVTPDHLLGTDSLGRDILSRLIWGARVSLSIAIVPVLFSVFLGILLGLLSGYYGGLADTAIMRTADILFAFPPILLAIAIVTALGASPLNAILALTIVFVPSYARLVRASTLSVRSRDYVEAARAMGASDIRILRSHVLTNVLSPIIVFATLQTGQMIIFSAALSFLGLGVQPPTPDWGAMTNDGRGSILVAPWIAAIPGLAIFLVSMGFNMLGDGLRDAFDPTMRVA